MILSESWLGHLQNILS